MAACTSAEALSSVADAEITMESGQPCFSVPVDPAAGPGALRIHALTVTQTERTDWRNLPVEMWGFTIDASSPTLDGMGRGACIRYGALPRSGRGHGDARPLAAARIYRVEINVRPLNGDSATLGYEARFCIKPQADRASELRSIIWDERAQRWVDEVCSRD